MLLNSDLLVKVTMVWGCGGFTEAPDHDGKSSMVKWVSFLWLPVVLTLKESLTSSKIIATLNHLGVLWLYNNDYYSLPLVISLEKVQFKHYFSQVR